MNSSDLDKLSREDLYQKVWFTPGSKLSEEYGISDVAIAKRCQKLNIPRPARGYWAKIEAGKKATRPPLPPTPAQSFIVEAQQSVGKSLTLPKDSDHLHPLAAEFLSAVKSASLSYDKIRVHIRERTLPEADISKGSAIRAAGAFHVLLSAVEPRGIQFRKSRSSSDGGHFRRGNDYLYFKIEENLVPKPETPGRRRPYYASREDSQIAGEHLSFTFTTERYISSKPRRWIEDGKVPIATMLAEMVQFICDHYVAAQQRHEAEAIERERQRVESEIRHRKFLEEEMLRRDEQAKLQHAKSLREAQQQRENDLAKAAEWWRLHQSLCAFISECESRWLDAGGGKLSDDQKTWLRWARATANALSPFESGYPDPMVDGAFDSTAIQFGGPYPVTREFPQPPTMPVISTPIVVKQGYEATPHRPSSPEPFPFWLKHPRH